MRSISLVVAAVAFSCGVSTGAGDSLATGTADSQGKSQTESSLTALEAETAVGRFMSAVAAKDEPAVLAAMTSRGRDAAKAAGPEAVQQLIALQRKGIVEQFNSKPQVARLEAIGPNKWRVFFTVRGQEHSKPAVLVREGSELLVSPFGDETVGREGQLRQAALGDRYDWQWKLSNYTQNAAYVYCHNTSWMYGHWVGGSYSEYTCPSWQCTWFGSTCTYLHAACANQIFGDDWWYYGGDPGCYGAFY